MQVSVLEKVEPMRATEVRFRRHSDLQQLSAMRIDPIPPFPIFVMRVVRLPKRHFHGSNDDKVACSIILATREPEH